MNPLIAQRAWCDRCGRRVLQCRLNEVQVSRQTHSEPAEYELWCESCAERDPRDTAYERAAARARLNDFERSNFKDWT